ncbi:hypothetical protein [Pedobacter metabolipauper]|uniref:Uncharacterized protein n=1 Tax=Pedobacter metabolipauper TaxID=425513 RepID=A0A4R6SSD8_9SPHI|nr:hypothetical protein [Pedobacter metabolipauper]TDQ08295.1 hypothetical protein ATK78_2804 [Pedobacter metabolipauper]
MNNRLKIGLILLLVSWLFMGVKVDDEFGDRSVFLKYRPSFQVWFKSPLGMQDLPKDYPPELKAEEETYDEFVNGKHWSDHYMLDAGICGILILGTSFFMITGIKRQFKYK